MKDIKDPIYGYIHIEDFLVPVLNSSSFQRLRHIIQTSYSSLYPSSLHNRFSHSLGVYNLGRVAFNYICINSHYDLNRNTELFHAFLFACLCHDIGHTPFSHTGEIFYDSIKLTADLSSLLESEGFNSDLKKVEDGVKGKQHEIMSALLSIKLFPSIVDSSYHEFIARCIIGLKYSSDSCKDDNILRFRNACIELLNSTIIDVDKLDYIIRDGYMAGYNNLYIDYERLLSGLLVGKNDASIAFNKKSISVLETVLNAHDLEVKWVQSHPSICYEVFLLQAIISIVSQECPALFGLEPLLEEGIKLNEFQTIRLFCDADVLFLAKQKSYEKYPIIKEYFDRNNRKKPVWKSESEFKVLFSFVKEEKQFFGSIIKDISDTLISGRASTFSVDEDFLKYLNKEKNEIDNDLNETLKTRKELLEHEIRFVELLRDFSNEVDIPFNFVVIPRNKFVHNFSKQSFKDITIVFSDLNKTKKMSDISNFKFDAQDNDQFFYLFYKNDRDNKKNILELSKRINEFVLNLNYWFS